MSRLVLHNARIGGDRVVDLVIENGRFAVPTDSPADEVVDLDGRVVLPGIVDHHTHLFALAASLASIDVSPAALMRGGGLVGVLREARRRHPSGWLRAVGYDPDVSGSIDRWSLDEIGVGPVRVQDRTGALWVLDSRALDAVLNDVFSGGFGDVLAGSDRPAGVEVLDGEATGCLWRMDGWLRSRVPSAAHDVSAAGAMLASWGVTTLTDAGATNGLGDLEALAAAELPQRIIAMTADPDVEPPAGIELGPVKILLDDDRLPHLDTLGARIEEAHRLGRRVAVHCVTPAQTVLAITAGIGSHDRIEHGFHLPDEVIDLVVKAGPTVVVSPGFVASRGDRYLAAPDLVGETGVHRLGSLLAAGLRLRAGSDAPYGPADPWCGFEAALTRRTDSGASMAPEEAVGVSEALALMWPEGVARVEDAFEVGRAGDLVVCDVGREWLLSPIPQPPPIEAVVIGGTVVHGRLERLSRGFR